MMGVKIYLPSDIATSTQQVTKKFNRFDLCGFFISFCSIKTNILHKVVNKFF